MTSFGAYLQKISQGLVLSEQEMAAAIETIMDGHVDDASLGAFLTQLAARGETAAEITGAARALRAKAHTIDAPPDALDCCGTGGDGAGTYNISTATALVLAACGIPVAKHGNRAASSKAGTADTLESLGVNLDMPPPALEQALRELNFCFLMAGNHHRAMKHVAPVRKALGTRTIFNLLGPLANPAGAAYQLLGVFDRQWVVPLAQTLKNLGATAAWVVCGGDGLDEITLTGPTYTALLERGAVTEKILTPEDFGLNPIRLDALRGGDAAFNAAALRALLGGEQSAYRDIVLANAAAALRLRGKAADLKQGVNIAAQAIDSAKAFNVLENYISFSNEARA